ncbi:hypothetical protein HPP92_007248 [Vanilla planifolia]|uniref:Uncharacterized protein n=1 Tax=Vanilla planifolia TaxID=51239 RepID=A0A835V7M2_VANPL|nr:hypothetical protein HPP92_007248 [Vanilla planifolia]
MGPTEDQRSWENIIDSSETTSQDVSQFMSLLPDATKGRWSHDETILQVMRSLLHSGLWDAIAFWRGVEEKVVALIENDLPKTIVLAEPVESLP